MIPISSKPYPYFLPGSPPQFSGCWHRPLWGARNCPDCVTYICQSLALKLSRSAQTSSPKSNFCLDLDKDLLVDFWGSWRPSKTLLPFALFSCMMIPLKSRTLRVFKIYTKLLFCMTYNSLMMWYFSYCNNKIYPGLSEVFVPVLSWRPKNLWAWKSALLHILQFLTAILFNYFGVLECLNDHIWGWISCLNSKVKYCVFVKLQVI